MLKWNMQWIWHKNISQIAASAMNCYKNYQGKDSLDVKQTTKFIHINKCVKAKFVTLKSEEGSITHGLNGCSKSSKE